MYYLSSPRACGRVARGVSRVRGGPSGSGASLLEDLARNPRGRERILQESLCPTRARAAGNVLSTMSLPRRPPLPRHLHRPVVPDNNAPAAQRARVRRRRRRRGRRRARPGRRGDEGRRRRRRRIARQLVEQSVVARGAVDGLLDPIFRRLGVCRSHFRVLEAVLIPTRYSVEVFRGVAGGLPLMKVAAAPRPRRGYSVWRSSAEAGRGGGSRRRPVAAAAQPRRG